MSLQVTYLYRIIGGDSNKKVKLLKEIDIGKMQWYSEDDVDVIWSNSLVYTNFIGIFFIIKYFYKFVESMTRYDKKYLSTYAIILFQSYFEDRLKNY